MRRHRRQLAVALIHHPVVNREGAVFTTTLTGLDMHDMARSARTFGAEALHIVHPYAAQREMAERIRRHWVDGPGGRRIPDRATALRGVTFDADVAAMRARYPHGEIELWTTAAQPHGEALTSYPDARARLAGEGPPVVVCFGTGWGLDPQFIATADVRLLPIEGVGDDYNHLSVRAACAITLDRLLAGPRAGAP
ncbi:MAG: RNA methyltransferase [Myxococcota bacterium]